MDKVDRRENRTQQAVRVGNALKTYALASRNAALAVRVSVTPSTFIKARDTEVAQIATRIRDEAASRVTLLTDYGIDGEQLTLLSEAIAAYHDLVPAPRQAINDRKAATATLKTAFARGDEIFDTAMDKLIPMLAARSPAFGTEFRNARIIVNSGTRAREVEEGEEHDD